MPAHVASEDQAHDAQGTVVQAQPLGCRCTADCGWITGHTYLTYGPLLNGAVNLVFEGVPTYPSPSRCWEIVEKYKVQ